MVGIRKWLLKQLNADDTLDAVAVTVKLAVTEFGRERVAKELRRMAQGWTFPKSA